MDLRPDLADARALLARAQKHFDEFVKLIHPSDSDGLWQIDVERDSRTGMFYYLLRLNRQLLIDARPVLADSANNISSALDHIASAIAKANGCARSRSLYYPWGFTDAVFERKLKKIEPILGRKMSAVLAEARAKHRHEVHHVEAAKQISNSGKHWELMFAVGSAEGVVLSTSGSRQRIFQIPNDAFSEADSFEFHRGTERLPPGSFNVVLKEEIRGLAQGLPTSPFSIFECSFRFVEGVISTVAGVDHSISTTCPRR